MIKIVKKTRLIKRIEDELNGSIEDILLDLYVVQDLTVEEVCKKLRLDRKNDVIKLLKSAGIYSHKLSSLDSII